MLVKKPAVAGTFYTAHPDLLKKEIEDYLEQANIQSTKAPLGFVVPHAGYIYSGPIAATGYQYLMSQNFEKVLILAASHFDSFYGLSIYPGDGLETPLGVVTISEEDKETLTSKDVVVSSHDGFRQEHALEVQLPFLQVVLKPGWKVIPLVMGFQNRDTINQAAKIIGDYIRESVLIIISSDLSHYHSYDSANEIDGRFCNLVESGNLTTLWEAHESRTVEACGFGPVFAFLSAIEELPNVSLQVLDYRNSGDTAGTRDNVVGYCCIGCFKE